ncbi:methionyl-tRNA formyltransferase [bacterium]|nr:methionyl-tRNA formyltransferase [bacterium]
MKIVIVGYDKMFSNLILGTLESKHKIVGVFRHERVSIHPFLLFFKDIIAPSKDYSFIKSLKLHEINARSVNSTKFKTEILKLNPDLILVGSWSEKFKKPIIELPKIGTINCHPSLLPRYRGPNPYMRVIMNGEKETGVSFHLMDENLDTGPVLLQKKIDIKQGFDGDTGESLKNKCCNLARTGIFELLNAMNDDLIIPINQNEKEASYYPQISEKDILINFEKSSTEINSLMRALTPWQPAYIAHKRSFLQVKKIRLYENNTKCKTAGTVIKKTFNTIWITTGDNKIAKIKGVKLFGKFAQLFTPFYLIFFVKTGDICK